MGKLAWRIGVVPSGLQIAAEDSQTAEEFERAAKRVGWSCSGMALHKPFVLERSGDKFVALVTTRSLRARYFEWVGALCAEVGVHRAFIVVLRDSWREEPKPAFVRARQA